MTLSNVKLILAREIRDQLRDRRTLFMIAVLPILLYPLLGMSMFQLSQFAQQQPTRVLVVGARDLGESPALFEKEQFAARLFADPAAARLLDLHFAPQESSPAKEPPADARAEADRLVRSGRYEAALYFPPDFARRLDAFRKAIRRPAESRLASVQPALPLNVPSPDIIHNSASEKSRMAVDRLQNVLRRWTEQIGDDNLALSGVPTSVVQPFVVGSDDVAQSGGQPNAAMWSKILPVLLLVWALTGAFYPAIDLCAGEKERGTLETLLSSPAQRSEIVLGKLITIMLFSIFTAVLNMVSLGITTLTMMSRLTGFGLPPPAAIVALGIALLPISALFSSLCLALAAFARSTKEGQYYLMPLLLVTMPLVILPMTPGVELSFGNSLIPVTGVVLLLRSVLEGNYWQAAQYAPVVAMITLGACLLSIRWAVEQFNSESVLFGESERLDVRLWLRHVLRDRRPTPTVAAAAFCGVLILMVQFFMSLFQTMPSDFSGFAGTVLTTQLAVIAAPALAMTVLFTGSLRQTLLLRWPPWATIPAAALLAVALHPTANVLQALVRHLYPVSENVLPALEKMQKLFHDANFWPMLLVIAVLPAICEELAFRGFILSGFRHLGHKWRAIIFSAILFGVTHGILQQSLIASMLGMILGYLAVQTGSIVPCMVFHVLHNTLAVANSRITPDMVPHAPLLGQFVTPVASGGCLFEWPLVVVGIMAAALLLTWFGRLNCPKSPEEAQEEAIHRGE